MSDRTYSALAELEQVELDLRGIASLLAHMIATPYEIQGGEIAVLSHLVGNAGDAVKAAYGTLWAARKAATTATGNAYDAVKGAA